MEPNEIIKQLEEVFADVLDLEEVSLTRETSSDDIAEWDSLSQIELLMAIEDEFSLKFSVEDATGVRCVGDILDLVDRKSNN